MKRYSPRTITTVSVSLIALLPAPRMGSTACQELNVLTKTTH